MDVRQSLGTTKHQMIQERELAHCLEGVPSPTSARQPAPYGSLWALTFVQDPRAARSNEGPLRNT